MRSFPSDSEGDVSRDPRGRHRAWLFALLLVAALALRVGFFVVGVIHLGPSTDEAANMLQAKRVLEGARPLLFVGQPYQFPLEAYLTASLVPVLPKSALGARLPLAVLAGLATAGFLLALWWTTSAGSAWPGLLLVLFPSVYWLLLQSAYFIPQHTAFAALAAATALLVATAHRWPDRMTLRFLAGLSAGLGFSNHMLAASLAAAAALVLAVGRSLGHAWKSSIAFGLGAASGISLHVAASMLEGGNRSVGQTLHFTEAVRRLPSGDLHEAFLRAFGAHPPLFPDFIPTLAVPEVVGWFVLLAYALVLVTATVARAARLARRLLGWRWPSLGPDDFFVLASWLCFYLFLSSPRSNGISPRYLLPAVFCFPFLVSQVFALANLRLRLFIGGAAVLFAAGNVAASIALMREWTKPDFDATVAEMPDLEPVLSFLRERGIRHCYASFWTAYRITYETDEEVICSQPFNERFFQWALPYKARVDSATDSIYILTRRQRRRFRPENFERDLARMNVRYQRLQLGEFLAYLDFEPPPSVRECRVPPRSIRVTASHNPEGSGYLADGHVHPSWTSRGQQERGMYVELRFDRPLPLVHAAMRYDRSHVVRARAPALRLHARTDEGWTTVQERLPADFDPFVFHGRTPVYGPLVQSARFSVTRADVLRIEILEPNPRRPWFIDEVELYRACEDG